MSNQQQVKFILSHFKDPSKDEIRSDSSRISDQDEILQILLEAFVNNTTPSPVLQIEDNGKASPCESIRLYCHERVSEENQAQTMAGRCPMLTKSFVLNSRENVHG